MGYSANRDIIKMEKLTIFGKNIPPEEKENVRDYIASEREQAKNPIDGEYEKIGEDYEIIGLLNTYVQEDLDGLKVQNMHKMTPEQIHLFPAITYSQKFSKAGTSAFYNPLDDTICVNADIADTQGKFQLYRDLLHEMIHMVSIGKFYLDEETVKVYRSGYRSQNPTRDHEHFNGLNEALIEKTVIDIFNKHRKEVIKRFNVTEAEEQKEAGYFCYYHNYIEILEVIVDRLSSTKGEEKGAIWKKLKRGLFTGEMMHLREIEKTFGKSSLQILDLLETDKMYAQPAEVIAKIKRYFETADIEERRQLAKELLSQ